ncbi:hypothetical protein SAMN04489812_4026 [Microlunatus soli]|uniref:Uncharacterized protein n=1 Tax=Microlunatus soli TaxID=630515 RepID=A0A1H1XCF7_9ACTN|nr:hypothetical protein SAMN04489812_4026 [Microlunatus soli]
MGVRWTVGENLDKESTDSVGPRWLSRGMLATRRRCALTTSLGRAVRSGAVRSMTGRALALDAAPLEHA